MILPCAAWRDALNAASSLSLELVTSAHQEIHNLVTGGSFVKNWPEQTFTRSWTRETPVTPRKLNTEEPDKTTPASSADKFWLGTGCCCWRCRWSVRVADESWGVIEDDGTWELPWDITDIQEDGAPPTTESGVNAVHAFAQILFGDDPLHYCQSTDEPGRSRGQGIRLQAHGIDLAGAFGSTVTYEDSAGGTNTGVSSTIGVAMPASSSPATPTEFGFDSCASAPSAWAQTAFAASGSDGSYSYALAASYRVTFTLG